MQLPIVLAGHVERDRGASLKLGRAQRLDCPAASQIMSLGPSGTHTLSGPFMGPDIHALDLGAHTVDLAVSANDGTRTRDLPRDRRALYSAELRTHVSD